MNIRFLGANRQVTGSRYLLQACGKNILIDCGMFQERQFLERNWAPCPMEGYKLDLLLLTHAHLDHCGLIPRLVKQGFSGPIYATPATIDLARLILEDSAQLQNEDLETKKRRHQREGRNPPHPYEPLYTVEDVARSLPLFRPVQYDQPLQLADGLSVTYRDAGHILGSAMLEIVSREAGGEERIVFSGDLGLWGKPLIRDPILLKRADAVIMESTYGDKDHFNNGPIEDQIAMVVNATVARGGQIIIPTFALERAQELLFYLSSLVHAGKIPRLPVFLDSPMAVDATEIFKHHAECLDEEMLEILRGPQSPFRLPGLVLSRTVDQSKAINSFSGSCIVLAGSGMCTGGRVKHHLTREIGRKESTILFVGYQSVGTLGRQILDGNSQVRILGKFWPVKAAVSRILGLSAHADREALVKWISAFGPPPARVFLTHGEEEVALTLAENLRKRAAWQVEVPEYLQEVAL